MRMTKKDEEEDEDGHIKDGMRASGHLRGPKYDEEYDAVQDRMRRKMRMTKKGVDEDEDDDVKDGMRASGHLGGPK